MNLYEQNRLFEEKYLSSNDNIFEAIQEYTYDTKRELARFNGILDESEALSAVLTGEYPKNLKGRKSVYAVSVEYEDRYISSVLSEIDDKDVKSSVIQTLAYSRSLGKLEYKYIAALSTYQRTRVRIICNMIWGNLYPQKGNKNE